MQDSPKRVKSGAARGLGAGGGSGGGLQGGGFRGHRFLVDGNRVIFLQTGEGRGEFRPHVLVGQREVLRFGALAEHHLHAVLAVVVHGRRDGGVEVFDRGRAVQDDPRVVLGGGVDDGDRLAPAVLGQLQGQAVFLVAGQDVVGGGDGRRGDDHRVAIQVGRARAGLGRGGDVGFGGVQGAGGQTDDGHHDLQGRLHMVLSFVWGFLLL